METAYLATHIEEDRGHWWFRGRLAVILAVLRRQLPPRRLRLLELGCGTGNVLEALGEFGEAVGMESHPELLAAARRRGVDARAGALPGDLVVEPGWADVVLLLDVLEHLDDDLAALRAARRTLGDDGVLVLTVPALPWLWTAHDVTLGHRRRYTAGSLRRRVERSGFTVTRATYFNTLLFPIVGLVRIWHRARRHVDHDLHRPPEPLNRLLAALFALERFLAPRVRLPVGSSLLLLGRARHEP
jgi:SAM-dependent methyltransferase